MQMRSAVIWAAGESLQCYFTTFSWSWVTVHTPQKYAGTEGTFVHTYQECCTMMHNFNASFLLQLPSGVD